MKSRNFRLAFQLLAAIVLTLQTATAQTVPTVPFSKISGYRPKSGIFPAGELNTQLFSRKEQFDYYFEPVPGTKPSVLNFSNQTIVACWAGHMINETSLSLEKIFKRNGVMEVYFKAVYGRKIKGGVVPSCFYNIGVDRSLSGINYYINGKLVQELRN